MCVYIQYMAKAGTIEIDLSEEVVGQETSRPQSIQARSSKRGRDSDSEATIASVRSIPLDDIQETFEHGRRYTNQTYFLPNDESEAIRSSVMHQLYLSALSGHLTYHRVRSNVRRILDIGSGAGDWAIAMAEEYPSCEIIATDIWPFQPIGIPSNLTYQIDDARMSWDFPVPFDYVHLRGLAGAFEDWSTIYKEILETCAEDGIVELADLSLVKYGVSTPDTALERYNEALTEAAVSAGISFGLEHLQDQRLSDASLQVFRKASIEIPVGQWHPDKKKESLGKLALVVILEGLEAQSLRLLTRHLNFTVAEVKELCDKVQSEILNSDLEPAMTCQIVVAKRIPNL